MKEKKNNAGTPAPKIVNHPKGEDMTDELKLSIMEKLVSIISQGAHSTRQYTDGNGQPMAFHYMDFVLSDGIDTFYAQATGKLSEALKPLDKNVLHKVQCHIAHRTFERQDGSVGHENQIYIDRIV